MSIKSVLMERDGISANEAECLIDEARAEMFDRIDDGEMPFDICEDFFGLDPDYIEELIG